MIPDGKVMWATPTRSHLHWCTVRRMMEIQETRPDVLFHIEVGNLGVSHVRNAIVKTFLQSECEALLQIDDDVVPPLDIIDMAASVTPEQPVIAAPYHIVRPEVAIPFPCVFELGLADTNGLRHFKAIKDPWREGRIECDGIGTGAMAIHRSLLEREEIDKPFLMAYDEQGLMRTSDDLAFCGRVRELDVPILADYRYFSDHMVEISMELLAHGYVKAYTKARAAEGEKKLVTLA